MAQFDIIGIKDFSNCIEVVYDTGYNLINNHEPINSSVPMYESKLFAINRGESGICAVGVDASFGNGGIKSLTIRDIKENEILRAKFAGAVARELFPNNAYTQSFCETFRNAIGTALASLQEEQTFKKARYI